MKFLSFAAVLLSCLPSLVKAGDNEWLSPVYKNFFSVQLPLPRQAIPKTSWINPDTGIKTEFYEIEIKPFTQQIYPGLKPAQLVGYNGDFPGPLISATRGVETVVRFVNRNSKPSSIHLHGSYSRAPFDGWAEDVIKPGEYKDYYYPNNQPPRTLWYHDHAVHITAENAYFGQAGLYTLKDDKIDNVLALPNGPYDVPLILQSKQYNRDGTLKSPEGETESLYGDVIHVNGQPWPYLEVEPRLYRFRLLNAAISRTFKLSIQDPTSTNVQFTVIASDGGYLGKPVPTKDIWVSMAERYEILVDFSNYRGKTLTMRNARKVGADDDYFGTDRVMQFKVKNAAPTVTTNNVVPSSSLFPPLEIPAPPANGKVDRYFKFERTNGEWRINGVAFADVKNRILAKPPRGRTEVWQLENSSGGWSHPVHIHLVDFNVFWRSGGNRGVQPYESAAAKDVVWLGPNEKVKVVAKYAPWDGVYMFHCHNLVHEDHDMMGAFNVTALQDFGYSEKTKFIDPMEDRWRAKPYSPAVDSDENIQSTLRNFSSLDAYAHVDEVQEALDAYWATHAKRDEEKVAESEMKWGGGAAAKAKRWSKVKRDAELEERN